jgi:hypothetical protein
VRKSYLWRLTSPQPSLPAVASTPPEKINRALGRTRIRATSPWTRDKGRRHRATRRWRAHQRVDAHADERACGGAITTSHTGHHGRGALDLAHTGAREGEGKERKQRNEKQHERRGPAAALLLAVAGGHAGTVAPAAAACVLRGMRGSRKGKG